MRTLSTWYAHIVNLHLSEPIPMNENWRRVVGADQAEMVINQLEVDLETARAGYATDQEIRGSSALKAENHRFAEMLRKVIESNHESHPESLSVTLFEEIEWLLDNRLQLPPDTAERDREYLRADLNVAREALRWIASGPTWGPGAPDLARQAQMQSDKALEALSNLTIAEKIRGNLGRLVGAVTSTAQDVMKKQLDKTRGTK